MNLVFNYSKQPNLIMWMICEQLTILNQICGVVNLTMLVIRDTQFKYRYLLQGLKPWQRNSLTLAEAYEGQKYWGGLSTTWLLGHSKAEGVGRGMCSLPRRA